MLRMYSNVYVWLDGMVTARVTKVVGFHLARGEVVNVGERIH